MKLAMTVMPRAMQSARKPILCCVLIVSVSVFLRVRGAGGGKSKSSRTAGSSTSSSTRSWAWARTTARAPVSAGASSSSRNVARAKKVGWPRRAAWRGTTTGAPVRDAAAMMAATVSARTRGQSTGATRSPSIAARSRSAEPSIAPTHVWIDESIPRSGSGFTSTRAPCSCAIACVARASARLTTKIGAAPASRSDARSRARNVRPSTFTTAFSLPIRRDAPAASTHAATFTTRSGARGAPSARARDADRRRAARAARRRRTRARRACASASAKSVLSIGFASASASVGGLAIASSVERLARRATPAASGASERARRDGAEHDARLLDRRRPHRSAPRPRPTARGSRTRRGGAASSRCCASPAADRAATSVRISSARLVR